MKISYLHLKMYWNRANSHIAIPFSIFEKFALMAILLKLFNFYNMYLIIIGGILFILGMILAGYLDVKYKLYEKENTLNNEHNKELSNINNMAEYYRTH